MLADMLMVGISWYTLSGCKRNGVGSALTGLQKAILKYQPEREKQFVKTSETVKGVCLVIMGLGRPTVTWGEFHVDYPDFVTSEPYPMGTKCFFTWQSSGQAVRLTTYLHLEPRSQMTQAVTLLPHPSAWYMQGLYLLYQGNTVLISSLSCDCKLELYLPFWNFC
jgi:hypothetical protein